MSAPNTKLYGRSLSFFVELFSKKFLICQGTVSTLHHSNLLYAGDLESLKKCQLTNYNISQYDGGHHSSSMFVYELLRFADPELLMKLPRRYYHMLFDNFYYYLDASLEHKNFDTSHFLLQNRVILQY